MSEGEVGGMESAEAATMGNDSGSFVSIGNNVRDNLVFDRPVIVFCSFYPIFEALSGKPGFVIDAVDAVHVNLA
jgi:hypothetical protein